MLRRDFIKKTIAASAAVPFVSVKLRAQDAPLPALPISVPKKTKLPRYRGFNLLNMFLNTGNKFKGSGNYDLGPFHEEDFEIIKGWGFDFARLPLSYWCWSSEDDWFRMDENTLKQLDQAVEWGKQYGVHININFHRAPGYCINPDPEITLKTNLFTDEAPLEAFCFQWKKLAERYKGIPSSRLSFDLVNEPPGNPKLRDGYIRVVRAAVKAIRDADADRLICADGYAVGGRAVDEFADIENFFQSSRGYAPSEVTHYKAHWNKYIMNMKDLTEETLSWPLKFRGKTYDKNFLRELYRKNWDSWEMLGGSVHCGEFGCYNQTPARVANAWFKDELAVLKERNWGWALWRLRGAFGVIDNDRPGSKFENFRGGKLDRELLEILKQG